MARERPLKSYGKIREFLQFLYGDQEGFSYAPTKIPDTKIWEEHYFEWPGQERQLIEHIRDKSPSFEVYVSPALFRTPTAKKSAFKSSGVVWVEFDGELPQDISGLPAPNRVIRSSTTDHQHWYWKLPVAINDPEYLELLTKRVTYELRGDLGTWNCNRVLRPVNSKHHESGREVLEVNRRDGVTSDAVFLSLPEAPEGVTGDPFKGQVPDVEEVIRKYPIPDNLWKRLQLARPEDTSESLCFVAYRAAEISCTDAEIFSLLLYADDKWGKFKGRSDRIKRLTDILDRAKIKRPKTLAEEEAAKPWFTVQNPFELIESQEEVKWIIPDIIHETGLGFLTSQPGVGKTQFSIRTALGLATGKNFIDWSIEEPKKILFVTLEMHPLELKWFFAQMLAEAEEADKELIRENFKVVSLDRRLMLELREHQERYKELIDEYTPVGAFIDSFSTSLRGSSSDYDSANEALRFIRELSHATKSFTWYVHHDRKPMQGSKVPIGLADMYGSQAMERDASIAMNMYENKDGDIELRCTKARLSKRFDTKVLTRTTELDFELSRVIQPEVGIPIQEGMDARSGSRSQPGTQRNTGRPPLAF